MFGMELQNLRIHWRRQRWRLSYATKNLVKVNELKNDVGISCGSVLLFSHFHLSPHVFFPHISFHVALSFEMITLIISRSSSVKQNENKNEMCARERWEKKRKKHGKRHLNFVTQWACIALPKSETTNLYKCLSWMA